MDSWVLQPIFSTTLVIIIAVIILLLLLVGPSFQKLTVSRRWSLIWIRLAVIAMAMLAILRPGCVQKIEKNQSAVLLCLIDLSRSMELPHHSDESTRWGALTDAINENKTKIQQLKEKKIEMRFFGFDNQVRALETDDSGFVTLPESPDGGETDIGSAIYATSQEVRNERLIGVIVASDGVQNALYPEIELTRAADGLQDMEVPIWAVTLGLPGNTGQLADISITNLPEQHRVSKKNVLTVKATMVSRGYANQPIKVQLIIVDENGNESVQPPKVFTPTKAFEELPITLKYTPPEAGRFRLRVRAERQPGEVAFRNNELPSFLTVDEQGMGVLYVDGNIGFENKFLRRSIAEAAQGINVSAFTIYETTRNRWPEDQLLEQYFSDPNFDVFIIGDLDSSAMFSQGRNTKALEALAKAVRNGKGLLMLGGYHSFGPGRYHQTPLADLLPIKMDPTEGQDFGSAKIRKELHIDRPIKLRPTKDHFLTRLQDEGDAREIWRELPELAGANFFVGVKNSADVLLESDAGDPILVSAEVGGRVLAFAGDTSWRWYRHGFQDEYNRFWRQIILWLTNRDGKSDDSVRVFLPQRRFQPKTKISFSVEARSGNGIVINDADFVAELTQPNGEVVSVNVNQTNAKNKTDLEKKSVNDPGLYKIKVTGQRNGVEIGTAEEEFIVFDRDKEKAVPAANPEQMARIASQTEEYGGRPLTPDKLGGLLDEILANPPVTKIEIPTKWKLGESWADASAFLVLFVLLLTVEWTMRKKWGMV